MNKDNKQERELVFPKEMTEDQRYRKGLELRKEGRDISFVKNKRSHWNNDECEISVIENEKID